MKLQIDPASMTLGDMEDYEAASGSTVGRLIERFEDGGPIGVRDFTTRELVALVWVFARRADPGLTVEDVREMRLIDLEFESPPSEASGAPRGSTGSPSSRESTGSRPQSSGD